MHKFKNYIWEWLMGVSLIILYLFSSARVVSAAENPGFTHSHSEKCIQKAQESCTVHHNVSYHEEHQTRFCNTCGKGTDHKLTAHTYHCTKQNDTWQPDGVCTCTVCGTSTGWVNPPGKSHTYTVERKVCGMEEGEITAVLSVSADSSGWTNKAVGLTASVSVLKDDASSQNISLSWPEGKMSVTQNGTYTVTAQNGMGQSISASVTVSCIDTTAPVISGASGDTAGMSKTAISVTVAASDAESGLADAPFSTDGGNSFGTSNTFTVTEGSPVTFVVRDKAGNTASKTIKRGDFPYPAEKPKDSGESKPGNNPGNQPGNNPGNKPGNQPGSNPGNQPGSGQDDQKNKPGQNETDTGSSGKDSGKTKEQGGSSKDNGKSNTGKNTGGGKNTGDAGNGKKGTDDKDGGNSQGGTGGKSMDGSKKLVIARLERERLLAQKDLMEADRLAGGLIEEAERTDAEENVRQGGTGFLSGTLSLMGKNPALTAGGCLAAAGLLAALYLFWYFGVDVYCYDGGEEYKRLGLLFVRKKQGSYELQFPEGIAEDAGKERFRLVFKGKLIKKARHRKLTIRYGERKILQSMEECVDFVL